MEKQKDGMEISFGIISELADFLQEAHENAMGQEESMEAHKKEEPDCSYCAALWVADKFLKTQDRHHSRFTVFGYYSDNDQRAGFDVKAADAPEAERKAIARGKKMGGVFVPVVVLPGVVRAVDEAL